MSEKTELQKIIDKAVPLLRKQGRRSHVDGWGCRYRGPNGDKCLFGHIIEEDYYRKTHEGFGVNEPIVVFSLKKSNPEIDFDQIGKLTLRALQALHDETNDDLSDFEANLASFCEAHNLTVPS